jgi:two-component system, sensor histidine kinase
MLRRLRISITRKIMLLVVGTTVSALVLSAVGLVVFDLRSYERQRTEDLYLQAEIIARASAPALAFDDRRTAEKDLALVRVRPLVIAAAIYTEHGELFARYLKPGEPPADFPARPGPEGYRIQGGEIVIFHRVVEGTDPLGTIYIRARYVPWGRVVSYLAILGIVMVASLALATVISGWLQHGVTDPILEVARVAREVMNRRDYALRARKTSEDEIGDLVDAFNGMLAEAGRRAEALREADRRKDEFLATLAHELRNPLAPLRNAVEILRAPEATPDMRTRALQMMERQLRQMVRLVDDLLDVSRITTGKLGVRKSVFDVRDAVRDAVDTVRPFLDSRGHAFEARIAPEPLMVDGDAARLGQVIGNLLHNAAKFTRRGDGVTLSLRSVDGEAEIRVHDTGAGIDAAVLPHIFDPFVQGQHTLARSEGGLGLGLALVKGITELHRGTVRVESGGRGRGAEFLVRLPLAAHATSQNRRRPTVKPADAVRRVLIVDDNHDAADSMAEVVEMLGHTAEVAYDGPSAIEKARATCPDVVLCDIGLPGMSGYEVAGALRALAQDRMLLVAVTGYTQPEDTKKAVESGFDRHLAKPASAEDIERLLE